MDIKKKFENLNIEWSSILSILLLLFLALILLINIKKSINNEKYQKMILSEISTLKTLIKEKETMMNLENYKVDVSFRAK